MTMILTHILAYKTLAVLASFSNPLCDQGKPPEINVLPRQADIQYDVSRSFSDLKRQPVDTKNPYAAGEITRTQGLMAGALQLKPSIAIGYRTHPGLGLSCVWYSKIDIGLNLTPRIFIAREVNRDPCMRQAVLNHERQHVEIDRRLVDLYAQIMGDHVSAILKQDGFNSGPIASREVDGVSAKMQQAVFGALQADFARLETERVAAQAKIDTRAEYDRIAAQCPLFRN